MSDGVNNATYSYLANSPLVSQILFKSNTTVRLTTSKSYDYLNRLTSISSVGGASSASPISFNYNYNDANQRTRSTLGDNSYWLYEYDSLGQVKSGKRYWSDQTPVAGQQFEYGFDDIGNRKQTKSGGTENGGFLRDASYTVNSKNQYTSRDVPAYADVIGLAIATNTVTVNSASTYRKGEYFRRELSVNNASAAVWQSVTVATNGVTGATGNIFVPKDDEVFTHDTDGNLTGDGRWSYEWDGENRLKTMRSLSGSPAPERRLVFEYDARGRRIRQTVWNDRDDGQGSELSDALYLYDGWNLIAELNANASNARVRTAMWGLDLSGSEQGAGGVGGLLQVVYYGSATTNCFAAFDGNGNVAALVNAANGETVAQYEYGPFAEVIRMTGAMAKANPFRFSTKYQDGESDLLYYGYRFYNQSTGRWLSRDPLADLAFYNNYMAAISDPERLSHVQSQSLNNPYLALLNDAVGHSDPDGAVPALLIFGVGRVISSGILACYNCSHCYKCLKTAEEYGERAAKGLEPDRYLQWVTAAKPGSECMSICADCGLNVLEVIVWVGGRYLVLKYYAGGHY